MQLWLLKLNCLNCTSRNVQCNAYKYLTVILVCSVCSITVSVFKKLTESSYNKPCVCDSIQGTFLYWCIVCCYQSLALQDWCWHQKHLLWQQQGTAAQDGAAGQNTMEKQNRCQKRQPASSFPGMLAIRRKGIKWLGHKEKNAAVKGAGNGEREVKHRPYILGTNTVTPEEWKYFF